jgi:hypothetical protein
MYSSTEKRHKILGARMRHSVEEISEKSCFLIIGQAGFREREVSMLMK